MTTKELVGFVSGIDGVANCLKLVKSGLEYTSVVSDHASDVLHQLEISFETNFVCFRLIAEGIFQGGLDLTSGGESNSFRHGFLNEEGKK